MYIRVNHWWMRDYKSKDALTGIFFKLSLLKWQMHLVETSDLILKTPL
jgi:hypothetical protein